MSPRAGDSSSPGRWAGDGGAFGTWSDDPPVFHVSPDRPAATIWHQVGNDRLTATAHPEGHVVVYSADAGLVRLTPDHPDPAAPAWEWLAPDGTRIAGAGDPGTRLQWQVGGAMWEVAGSGWAVTRQAWAPFGADRMLRLDTEVTVSDPALRGGTLVERWTLRPLPIVIGAPASRFRAPPRQYPPLTKAAWTAAFAGAHASRLAVAGVRRLLARRLRLDVQPDSDPDRGVVVLGVGTVPRWQRDGATSLFATIPGRVALATVAPGGARITQVGPRTVVELRTRLSREARSHTAHVFALAPDGDAAALVARGQSASRAESERAWQHVWRLDHAAARPLARESRWHAGMLRSSQVAEPRFAASYVAQGSAYGFLHGLQGGIRDYAMFLPPLCLVDPPGARSLLLTMLRLQSPDGRLAYAHTGAGHRTSSVIHHAPTDLPIALMWAATEYVWSTGDSGFLDQWVPWRPGSAAPAGATVADRLLIAFEYLRSQVGVGAHGLLRVGSGDWNDPIGAMARNRRAFHASGESVYNAAFAAHVLPRAADLLADRSPRCAARMRELAEQQLAALGEAWTGRWFLRTHDGSGGFVGRDRLYLDANAWCLIAGAGTAAQRRELVRNIEHRLMAPSPIGALCLDAPTRVRGGMLAPGWDTNGGVWAALDSLLAWGLALHEPDLSVVCLQRQLLAAHAAAYPGVWCGIWSGPDAYNAHYAADPGGTYVQPATPMAEFPIMNANAHAGPLLALMRVLGLETGPDGLRVRRSGPLTGWRLSCSLGTFSG